MRINKSNKPVQFKDIEQGEVFLSKEQYYIKTRTDTGELVGVNLERGDTMWDISDSNCYYVVDCYLAVRK